MKQVSFLLLIFLIYCLVSCKEESSKSRITNLDETQVVLNRNLEDDMVDTSLRKDTTISDTAFIDKENLSSINQSVKNDSSIVKQNLEPIKENTRKKESNADIVKYPSNNENKKKKEISSSSTTDNIGVKDVNTNRLKLDSIVFDNLVLTYDTISAGEKLKRKYYFTNKNDFPIEVVSTYPDCGCTAPSFPFLPIEKGERGFIGVDYNSVGKNGKQVSNIHIKFKDIKEEKIIKLIGFVKGKE